MPAHIMHHPRMRPRVEGTFWAQPDEDALQGEAAGVAALSDSVQVALAIAAGCVGEAIAERSQARQLQQLRGQRLHRAQQRVGNIASWLAGRLLAPEADAQGRQPAVLAQHAHAAVACPPCIPACQSALTSTPQGQASSSLQHFATQG